MRKLRKSTKQVILAVIITILVAVIAFAAVYFVFVNQVKAKYQKEINEYQELISSNQQYAYVTKDEIAVGDEITEDKVNYIQVFTGLSEDHYIGQDDFGKTAVVSIPANVPVARNMVSEHTVPGDWREEEFFVFYLSSNLQENDYIDLRILYPNGEDYSVLSKKNIKELSLEDGRCFLWLDAEEMLRISGAIIDAYLNEGTKLYTVKYVEPLVQEATKVTYIPNQNVINLIESDPNILNIAMEKLSKEVRAGLEDRLEYFYQRHKGGVSWDSKANVQKPDDIISDDGQEDSYYIE